MAGSAGDLRAGRMGLMRKINVGRQLIDLLPRQGFALLHKLNQFAFLRALRQGRLVARRTGLGSRQSGPRRGGIQRVAIAALESGVDVLLVVVLDGLHDARPARPEQCD